MQREAPRLPSTRLLWFALVGGGVAWSAQLLVDYVLVGLRCTNGSEVFSWAVSLFSLLMAAVTIAAGFSGYRAWKETGSDPEANNPTSPSEGRASLMALGGAVFNVLFLVLILMSMVPNTFMDPCRHIG
jgi:hypothetical protein